MIPLVVGFARPTLPSAVEKLIDLVPSWPPMRYQEHFPSILPTLLLGCPRHRRAFAQAAYSYLSGEIRSSVLIQTPISHATRSRHQDLGSWNLDCRWSPNASERRPVNRNFTLRVCDFFEFARFLGV
jgi:hypothetical protein